MPQLNVLEVTPFVSDAERAFTAEQVYGEVMEAALPLSVAHKLPPGEDEARDAFYEHVSYTPLEASRFHMHGHRHLVKDDAQQRSGAYKDRGMTYRVQRGLLENPGATRLSIASAGNAALGTTLAGNAYGLTTTAECVTGASRAKVGSLLANGADVHAIHDTLEAGMRVAQGKSERDDTLEVHPFDQVEVIAGQASVGWELLADLLGMQARGELDLARTPVKIFVPVGGGGLIAGVACVFRWAKDNGWLSEDSVQIYGVQMEGGDAMNRAMRYVRAGLPVPEDLFAEGEGVPFTGTNDGTAVRQPGQRTLPIVADRRFVADILLVSEGEVGESMERQERYHKHPVEPAGALSEAGARKWAEAHATTPRLGSSELLISMTTGSNMDDKTRRHFATAAANSRLAREAAQSEGLAAYRRGLFFECRPAPTFADPSEPDETVPVRRGTRVGHSLAPRF